MKTVSKNTTKRVLTIFAISLALISCSTDSKKETVSQEVTKKETPVTTQTKQANNNSQFEIVENEKVCMVNDRYMVVKQIPVKADGITYYGCCENCVAKIQNNLGDVRYSKDPLSGNKVDKATAIIVQNKENGVVFYFESRTSAEKFIASNS